MVRQVPAVYVPTVSFVIEYSSTINFTGDTTAPRTCQICNIERDREEYDTSVITIRNTNNMVMIARGGSADYSLPALYCRECHDSRGPPEAARAVLKWDHTRRKKEDGTIVCKKCCHPYSTTFMVIEDPKRLWPHTLDGYALSLTCWFCSHLPPSTVISEKIRKRCLECYNMFMPSVNSYTSCEPCLHKTSVRTFTKHINKLQVSPDYYFTSIHLLLVLQEDCCAYLHASCWTRKAVQSASCKRTKI